MAFAQVKIVDKQGTFKFLRALPKKTEKIGLKETWNLAQKGAKYIRNSAERAEITEWRGKMIAPIQARKRRKGEYVIKIPQIIARLDYLPSHFVALRRGRLITEWAKERFGTKRVSGLSKVYYGPRGGILYQKGRRSALFVTQRPFIERGFMRMVNEANRTINRIANKIVRG